MTHTQPNPADAEASYGRSELHIGSGAFRDVYRSATIPGWVYKYLDPTQPTPANHWEHDAWTAFSSGAEEWPKGIAMPETVLLNVEGHGPVLAARLIEGEQPPACTEVQCICAATRARMWSACWRDAAAQVTFEVDDVLVVNGTLFVLDRGQ
ncbi:hypothetical protein K378_01402 [Streptomyces sp. Amel2xB2]|uniref:hypothetical protein n=1 Tax=Streptomyces sp. Amel2xB2 TaxID=1305829 RepID=UPI000DB945F3|nr:hypothetical protein [Streptomyces sp. Amel2xB2]RAJ70237.1 hypothetical protein K378_01402 [Streptomyces sp. Amel2xB2]